MGQRLNLGIRKKGKIIANAYYHWAAYTADSFELVDKAYQYLKANSTEPELMRCVHALEVTGAGLEESEFEFVQSRRDLCRKTFNKAIDRDSGLLAISPKGIQSTEDWAEETTYIDIDNPEDPTFFFWVVWADDEDNYLEDCKENDITQTIVDYDFDADGSLTYAQLCQYIDDLCSGKAVRSHGRVYREIA